MKTFNPSLVLPRAESVLWMDYLLAGQGVVVVLMMVLVKEEYRRTSVDKAQGQERVVVVSAGVTPSDPTSNQLSETT